MRKLTFEVESASVTNDDPTSQFATAKILAFSSGYSRNDTYATPENLMKTAKTIYEKPIIYELSPYFNDFGSHNPKKTVPAGFVVPNSAEFIEQEDGRIGLQVMAKIWKKYSGKFMDIFKDTGTRRKKVSVEMELLEERKMSDGKIELLNWVYGAIAMLGDFVSEGSQGANMELITFSHEYQSDYMREFGMRYDSIDFTVPEDVKEIVKMGLDKGEITNSVYLAAARHLLKNEKVSPEKARHIYKNIIRSKKAERMSEYEIYGGQNGEKWLSEIVSQMDTKDNERMTMFSINGDETDNEQFSKKEVNQSMDENKETVEMETKPIDETMAEEPKKDEPKEETPEEEKNETPSEEKKEDEGKEKHTFSLDAYMDVAATLAFLEAETETFKEVVDDEKEEHFASIKMAVEDLKEKREFAEPAKVFKALFAQAKMMKSYAKMCKMESEKFAAENDELKKFKADVEAQQFNYQVDVTMKEVEPVMPKEEYEAAREDSKNFSLQNVDTWKNKVKAKAFTFAKNVKSDEKGVKIYALGWTVDEKKVSNGWDW